MGLLRSVSIRDSNFEDDAAVWSVLRITQDSPLKSDFQKQKAYLMQPPTTTPPFFFYVRYITERLSRLAADRWIELRRSVISAVCCICQAWWVVCLPQRSNDTPLT